MPRIFLFVLIQLFSFLSWSQTGRDGVQAYAVQQRPQQLKKEITLHASFLPADHFNHYLAWGGGYTHYFNSYFGWEVGQFNNASDLSTGLKDHLLTKYGALPETSDVIKYWASTNLVYTPLYMKHLFLGKSVIWGDLSVIGGYGMAKLEDTGNVSLIDLGAALRFFYNDNWAYKLDLRQYFFMTTAVKPNFGITLAISYNFGQYDNDKTSDGAATARVESVRPGASL